MPESCRGIPHSSYKTIKGIVSITSLCQSEAIAPSLPKREREDFPIDMSLMMNSSENI